jgi:hypothetical protein
MGSLRVWAGGVGPSGIRGAVTVWMVAGGDWVSMAYSVLVAEFTVEALRRAGLGHGLDDFGRVAEIVKVVS